MVGGGGDSEFAFGMLIFAITAMVVLPFGLNYVLSDQEIDIDQNELLNDYYDFTGASRGTTKEAVWVLTGIYTPYEGGYFGYTEDGWVYGSRITYNAPTQYQDTLFAFSVQRNAQGIYEYAANSADYQTAPADTDEHRAGDSLGTGHAQGDLYTNVVLDSAQKSDIFFSPQNKYFFDGDRLDAQQSGAHFYYEFTGYRYAFQPVSDSWTVDADGNEVEITATTTSLSLIWYSYYTADGIAGQLVLSGNDSGVAYLTSDQIVRAFDSTTNTARFAMTFNGGVEMGIYVKINSWYLSQGYTVQQAYDAGWWSIMVTSMTTDALAYAGTDYTLNIFNVFETLIDLMTFNYTSYGMSDTMGLVCSFIIVIPLYAGLISLAISSYPVLIFTGILAVLESVAAVVRNWTGIFGDWSFAIIVDMMNTGMTF